MQKNDWLTKTLLSLSVCIYLNACQVGVVEPALAPSDGGTHEPALVTAVEQGNRLEVQGLIAAGGDLNIRAYDGATALHRAAEQGNIDTAMDLVAHGANPKAVDEVGNTVLHRAAFSRNPKLLEYLLSLGLDPNAQNEAGTTPLLIVTAHNDIESAQVLLAHGAKAVFSHSLSPCPLKLARSRGLMQLVQLYEAQPN